MRTQDVKRVMQYYYEIPGMLRLLEVERRDTELVYDTRKAAGGMAGGGSLPGLPVEDAAARAEERGVARRLGEIGVRRVILEGDAETVRGCLDGLSGRYKRLLELRHRYRYSWGKISVSMEVPDSTARHWYTRAVLCLGEALEDVPMADELVGRASRARTT